MAIKNVRVEHFAEMPARVTVNFPDDTTTMEIPKGCLTIARQISVSEGSTTELSPCTGVSVLLDFQSATQARIRVCENNGAALLPLATLAVDGSKYAIGRHIPHVHVTGLPTLAQHIVRRQLPDPDASAVRALLAGELSSSNKPGCHDLVNDMFCSFRCFNAPLLDALRVSKAPRSDHRDRVAAALELAGVLCVAQSASRKPRVFCVDTLERLAPSATLLQQLQAPQNTRAPALSVRGARDPAVRRLPTVSLPSSAAAAAGLGPFRAFLWQAAPNLWACLRPDRAALAPSPSRRALVSAIVNGNNTDTDLESLDACR
jgi:hypothetical protein